MLSREISITKKDTPEDCYILIWQPDSIPKAMLPAVATEVQSNLYQAKK